jgi:hypothetical protein
MLKQYFSDVYALSRRLIDDWAFPPTPLSLEALLNVKRAEVEAQRDAAVSGFVELRETLTGTAAAPPEPQSRRPAGLNTIGMLSDRLTVLAMKEWVLENRSGAPGKATELRQTQVEELIDTLAGATPGYSSFTQKVTALRFEAPADTWEEAYFGLLATNVLLWEAQEVLYAGHIAELECAELRRYIAWFSEGNVRRNGFIAHCETTFWKQFPRSATPT